jgi:hypothetical protein
MCHLPVTPDLEKPEGGSGRTRFFAPSRYPAQLIFKITANAGKIRILDHWTFSQTFLPFMDFPVASACVK